MEIIFLTQATFENYAHLRSSYFDAHQRQEWAKQFRLRIFWFGELLSKQ